MTPLPARLVAVCVVHAITCRAAGTKLIYNISRFELCPCRPTGLCACLRMFAVSLCGWGPPARVAQTPVQRREKVCEVRGEGHFANCVIYEVEGRWRTSLTEPLPRGAQASDEESLEFERNPGYGSWRAEGEVLKPPRGAVLCPGWRRRWTWTAPDSSV